MNDQVRGEEEEYEVIVTTEEDLSDAEEAPKAKAKTSAKGRQAKKGKAKTPSKPKDLKDAFLDDDEPVEKSVKARTAKAQPTPKKTPARKARESVVEEQVEREDECDIVSEPVEEKKMNNRRSKAQPTPTPKKTPASQKVLEDPVSHGDEEDVRRSTRVRLESPDKIKITAKTPLRKNASVDALKASGQRLMRSMKSSDAVTKPASPSKRPNNGLVEESEARQILEERRSKNASIFREFRTGSFIEAPRSSRSSRPKDLKEPFPRLPVASKSWNTPRRAKKTQTSETSVDPEVSFASQSVEEVKEADGNVTEEDILEEDEEIIEENDNKRVRDEEEIATSEEEEEEKEVENELPHSSNVSTEVLSLGKRSRSASSVDEDDGETENHEPLSKVLRVSE